MGEKWNFEGGVRGWSLKGGIMIQPPAHLPRPSLWWLCRFPVSSNRQLHIGSQSLQNRQLHTVIFKNGAS